LISSSKSRSSKKCCAPMFRKWCLHCKPIYANLCFAGHHFQTSVQPAQVPNACISRLPVRICYSHPLHHPRSIRLVQHPVLILGSSL
jgi:hypothetical protein